jgi:hypothetical protein
VTIVVAVLSGLGWRGRGACLGYWTYYRRRNCAGPVELAERLIKEPAKYPRIRRVRSLVLITEHWRHQRHEASKKREVVIIAKRNGENGTVLTLKRATPTPGRVVALAKSLQPKSLQPAMTV